MSKYEPLWKYIKENNREDYKLTYSLYNPKSGEGGWVFKGHKE